MTTSASLWHSHPQQTAHKYMPSSCQWMTQVHFQLACLFVCLLFFCSVLYFLFASWCWFVLLLLFGYFQHNERTKTTRCNLSTKGLVHNENIHCSQVRSVQQHLWSGYASFACSHIFPRVGKVLFWDRSSMTTLWTVPQASKVFFWDRSSMTTLWTVPRASMTTLWTVPQASKVFFWDRSSMTTLWTVPRASKVFFSGTDLQWQLCGTFQGQAKCFFLVWICYDNFVECSTETDTGGIYYHTK